jgi:hypothetical protein
VGQPAPRLHRRAREVLDALGVDLRALSQPLKPAQIDVHLMRCITVFDQWRRMPKAPTCRRQIWQFSSKN